MSIPLLANRGSFCFLCVLRASFSWLCALGSSCLPETSYSISSSAFLSCFPSLGLSLFLSNRDWGALFTAHQLIQCPRPDLNVTLGHRTSVHIPRAQDQLRQIISLLCFTLVFVGQTCFSHFEIILWQILTLPSNIFFSVDCRWQSSLCYKCRLSYWKHTYGLHFYNLRKRRAV